VWTPATGQVTNPPLLAIEPADGTLMPGGPGSPELDDLWYPGNPVMDTSRAMVSYRTGQPVFRLANLRWSHGRIRFDVKLAPTQPEPAVTNAVTNPSIEAGAGAVPDGWSTVIDGPAVLERTTGMAHSGQASLAISSASPAFAQWTQTVEGLVPGRSYLLCAWVRGQDVVSHQGREVGANLLLSFTFDRVQVGFGTFDWTRRCLQLPAQAGGSLPVGCALGGWGNVATGTVWCDDIELTLPHAPF
jgi:hypothetical protein